MRPLVDTVEVNYRRNVVAFVLFDLIWGLGMPFVLYVTMVPAYLTVLGSPKALIGFVLSFWTIAVPIQLISGHWFKRNRIRNIKVFIIVGVGLRLCYDIAVIFTPGWWSVAGLIWLYIAVNFGYVVLVTAIQPLLQGVLTDNIPMRKRGRLFGFRTMGMGLGGIGLGFVAAWVLTKWEPLFNYQVCFLIGDSLFILSTFAFFLVRDHPLVHIEMNNEGFIPSIIEKARHLLHNPNYRIFLFFHILNAIALNMAAFIVPYAKEQLHTANEQIAYFNLVLLGVNGVFGIVIGRIADRHGYKFVSIFQSISLFIFFILAITARGFPAVCIAYGFYAIPFMSHGMVLCNMSVEICPQINAMDLTALGTIFVLPFIVIVSPLMGAIIDLTHNYYSVFFMGATFAFVALIGFFFLVREPRIGRLYVIKQIPRR